MNERIFELAEQANEYATTRHPVSNIALSVNSEKFVKKFAELIVRECARISIEADDTMTNQGEASAKAFMEYFGVEE